MSQHQAKIHSQNPQVLPLSPMVPHPHRPPFSHIIRMQRHSYFECTLNTSFWDRTARFRKVLNSYEQTMFPRGEKKNQGFKIKSVLTSEWPSCFAMCWLEKCTSKNQKCAQDERVRADEPQPSASLRAKVGSCQTTGPCNRASKLPSHSCGLEIRAGITWCSTLRAQTRKTGWRIKTTGIKMFYKTMWLKVNQA